MDGGVYYNLTPTAWAYTPDLSRKTAATRFSYRNQSLRLTGQPSPRNQLNFYFDNNPRWWYNRRIATNVSPEAATYTPYYPNYIASLSWKSPSEPPLPGNQLALRELEQPLFPEP